MVASLGKMLAIVAVAVAVAATYVQARGLRWTVDPAKLAAEQKVGQTLTENEKRIAAIRAERAISLDDLRNHIAAESIIVDARTAEQFAESHLSAPVIINIFGEEAARPESIARLSPDIAAGRPIVFYCNGPDCHLSDLVYIALEDTYGRGALDMYVFVPGWDGITANGIATTTGPESALTAAENDAVSEIPVSQEP